MKRRLFFSLGLWSLIFLVAGPGCISLRKNAGAGGAGPAGFFISLDKGENWQSISLLPTADGIKNLTDVSVYRVFPDPQDTNALYWASRGNGFFYTYDAGREWQRGGDQFANSFIYSVAVHPANKCTIYMTTGDRVYKSADCNRSWQEVYRESRSDGTRIMSLALHAFAPYEVYAAESNGDILRSVDQGKSWQVANRLGQGIDQMIADPTQKNTFYIATQRNGLFRSVDDAASWQSMNEKLQEFTGALEYRRLLIQPRGSDRLAIYWISTYGILRSDDRGATWTPYSLITPPGSAQIYGFAVNPNNTSEMYYTATISGRSTFYRTADNGANWTTRQLPSEQVPTLLYVHPDKAKQYLYLGFTVPPRS